MTANTLIFFPSLSQETLLLCAFLLLLECLSREMLGDFKPATKLSYCTWLETSGQDLARRPPLESEHMNPGVARQCLRPRSERREKEAHRIKEPSPTPSPSPRARCFESTECCVKCRFLSLWFVGGVQRHRPRFGCSIAQWNVLMVSLRNTLSYEATGQGQSPEKSKTAQILGGNFAQKTGPHNHWAEEVILVVLASLPLFLGCICVDQSSKKTGLRDSELDSKKSQQRSSQVIAYRDIF